MPRDANRDSLYLADIVEASRTVSRWLTAQGRGWHDDEILQNAVLRQLMVVGEAAACLSRELQARLPDIPWQDIRGFRNHAVHAYFSLDWTIVREVAEVNLPVLGDRAHALLREDFPSVAAALDRPRRDG